MKLIERFEQGKFVITCEVGPSKNARKGRGAGVRRLCLKEMVEEESEI